MPTHDNSLAIHQLGRAVSYGWLLVDLDLSYRLASKLPHPSQPALPSGLAGIRHHAEQAFADGFDADKAQNAAFQPLDAVTHEPPTIRKHGHPHGHHNPGGTTSQQLFRKTTRTIGKSGARAHHL